MPQVDGHSQLSLEFRQLSLFEDQHSQVLQANRRLEQPQTAAPVRHAPKSQRRLHGFSGNIA